MNMERRDFKKKLTIPVFVTNGIANDSQIKKFAN
jgi:sRNA-binding regulator protein Hfq